MKMKKIKYLSFSLLFVAMVIGCSKDYTHPIFLPNGNPSNLPSITNDNPNLECEDLNLGCTLTESSGKIDYYAGSAGDEGWAGIIHWWTDDGIELNWETTDGSTVRMAVIVKGGPSAIVYFGGCTAACVQSNGTVPLTAPIGPSGKPYGLSNFSFCWSLCEPGKVVALKGWLSTPAGNLHFVSDGNLLFSDQTGYWCEALGYNVPSTTFDVILASSPFTKIGEASITALGVVTLDLDEGYEADYVRFFVGTAAALDAQGDANGWCPDYSNLWTLIDY